MSELSPKPEVFAGLYVAVFWAAVSFAVDGVMSAVLDRDMIPTETPTGFGVLSYALTLAAVWGVWALGFARPKPAFAVVAGIGVAYLVPVLLAGLAGGIGLAAAQASSPFVIASCVVAAVGAVVGWAVIRRARIRATASEPHERL